MIGLAILGSGVGYGANTDDEARAKINFIQDKLNATAKHSLYWQYGWLAVMSANTALGVAAWQKSIDQNADAKTYKKQKDQQRIGRIDTISGALATGSMLLGPMPTHSFAKKLRAMPDSNAAELAAKLQHAEEYLANSAAFERFERSNGNRALSAFVNLSAALAVAFSTDEGASAASSFVISTLATELKIYTAPQAMSRAEIDYHLGKYQQALKLPAERKMAFNIVPTQNSIHLNIHF